MTQINKILDMDKLLGEIEAGYISDRKHPDFPQLSIYNYTEKAQYEGRWTPETMMCRGLIVNRDTDEVLARPFAKFFNWDQPEAPPFLAENAPVFHYADKFDGSLGILYRLPNGELAIATRGSFTSEQAIKGSELLHAESFPYDVALAFWASGYTPLFEIIYPENRIVLDYGKAEFLEPLGYIHIETGAFVPPTSSHYEKKSFHEVRMDLSRPNAEGWVVWRDPYTAVKIKQADYVELHRIVTGLNRKSIWRALKEGPGEFDALMEKIPDELHSWANGVKDELYADYLSIVNNLEGHYANVGTILEERFEHGIDPSERKEIANVIQTYVPQEYWGYMFSMIDGRDLHEKLWASIEPRGGDR